jgi:hypothetical protein
MNMKENRTPIDCVEFGELLPDLDRPGTLGSERSEEALAHAESCAPCATLMMEAESLNYGLRRLAETTVGAEAPARVEDALLREFRRAKAVNSRRKLQRDLVALAIAALVLLAVGLGIYRHPWNAASKQQVPAVAQNSTSSGVDSAATPAENSANNAAQPSTSESVADSADNEYATSFVPLPYADDPSESQGGSVVRVDLPRASLVSMGIPVAGLNSGGHVVADLMLSEDGTPQAIRLLSQSNSAQEF